jgi:hypothetical protein
MLGGETVIGNEYRGLGGGGQGAGVRLVAEGRPDHVPTAVQIEHGGLRLIRGGRDERRHPAGGDGPDARTSRRAEAGLKPLECGPCLVEAFFLCDEPRQRLEQPGDASEQFTTDRRRRGRRLVDVA